MVTRGESTREEGVSEGRGEGAAERQHGGDTSVAVLPFSPLEPGCQQEPPGPDSTPTPELRRRKEGSTVPSAAVSSFRYLLISRGHFMSHFHKRRDPVELPRGSPEVGRETRKVQFFCAHIRS